ncbi:MAG TPA: glycosyltransferase family 2 protein [Rhabdochlamydiaceae bacterium]|nr:glycosyltransferase family 2 protein [Rhabdochlamydiaceae bacterium]
METPKIYIIILNWNGMKDTLECLASVHTIRYPNFKTLVVDNGSSDDSVDAIHREFPQVEVLSTGSNLGFAEGNNRGIQKALAEGADYLFLLNNDTVVDPNILHAFVDSFKSKPALGILGGKNYLYEEKNKFDHFGGQWNSKKGTFDLIGNRVVDDGVNWEEMKEMDYACGCALFIKKEVFETIGLLEPRFFLIWEESDFCFRARREGFLTMSCPQAKLWHKVSVSFVGGKPHSTYFWWRNRLLWIERNCSLAEKISLTVRVLVPDILHIYKLRMLKSLQLQILLLVRPHENHKKRRERILKYRAALNGVHDYLFRRFGNGPSWIYHRD